MPNLDAGSRLGPYAIVSRIGAGGMGEVWRATDTRLNRSVAIKILPAEFAQNAQLKTRFDREAKTISQLNHPHICTVHDVGQENGIDYLVMELLEGENLADRLSKGPLPLEQTLRYGIEIASALDRAHHEGIIHRDLKPANIMLTKSGAKLLDFGLAKSGISQSSASMVELATQHKALTQEGMVIGTFQYMAPEQVSGEAVDARTDIFAFGAVLYEMITGTPAFRGKNRTSMVAAILSGEPQPISTIQPLTPPALERVVKTCLSKDPDDRWQTAHDVMLELKWIEEGGSQAGVAAPVVHRRRTRERLAWGTAAALAIAVAATAWLYARASREASRMFASDLMPATGTKFNAVGDESGALVVSPDGTLAVYSATSGGAPQLWLRSLTTGETKAFAGTERGTFPFWSPDSKRIGFFTVGQLKSVDVSGGAPIALTSVSAARGGSWGKDGWIVYTPTTQAPIFRVRSSGGTATQVTHLQSGHHTSHRWPAFLPDGKHFLYLAANHQNPTGAENGVYFASVDGGEPQLLMRSTSNAVYVDGYLLFNREQTLFAQKMTGKGALTGEPVPIAQDVLHDSGIWRGAFSASDNGVLVYHTGRASVASNLMWLDRSGKEIGRVGETAAYWDVDLSVNGQRLAIPTGDPLREMWIHDLHRNTRTRLPLDQSWAGSAAFSPDGNTVYLDVLTNGHSEVISRRVTGGGEVRLLQFNEQISIRGISPDGKTLLADSTAGHLMKIMLSPRVQATTLTQGNSHELAGAFSSDGKWIAYMSDQNGRTEVFVTSAADATQKWQVSNFGGTYPRWRGDGKELFYLDLTNRMTAVPIEANGDDLTIGTPHTLFSFTPRPQCRPYDVSADGQHFLVNAIAEQESPNAVLVSNWKARIKP